MIVLSYFAGPDSLFVPLDLVILLFSILSNHCPKKSWGGGSAASRPVFKNCEPSRSAVPSC